MMGQQLAQELAYQAKVFSKLEKLVSSHRKYVTAKNNEKAGGFAFKEMAILAVIIVVVVIALTNLVWLGIIAAVAIVCGCFYFRNRRNADIDQEMAKEESTYNEKYNDILRELTQGDHPIFNLPDENYSSFYLSRLSEIIASNQAQDLGTAVRILEDRLRSEANTRAVNRAADNSARAAEAANRAAENSRIAANWSAAATAAANNAAERTDRLAGEVESNNRLLNQVNNKIR